MTQIHVWHPADLPAIKEIFFLSSVQQVFPSEQAKLQFWQRWTEYYFEFCRDTVFVYRQGNRVVGYLTGCLDSEAAASLLTQRIPYYGLFKDQFSQFPAHFHINVHPDTRGAGVGAALVEHFCQIAGRGIHLVTTPRAGNVGFYRREGFRHEIVRRWSETELLFMGRPSQI